MDSEVETDLTNSEEYLYPLTKGQSVKGFTIFVLLFNMHIV